MAIVAIVFLVLIALVKPWPSLDRPQTAATPVFPAADPAPPTPTAAPTPTDPAAAVADICLGPGSWRIASIERWHDQTIRVWQAIQPAHASGPDDGAIPIVPAIASEVWALGFCAPVAGPGRPAGPATVTVWRRAAGPPTRIALAQWVPRRPPSPFGQLFAAPMLEGAKSCPVRSEEPQEPRKPPGWPAGTYVFRYAEADREPVWFGVEVVQATLDRATPSARSC
jgi:hypothetical protein